MWVCVASESPGWLGSLGASDHTWEHSSTSSQAAQVAVAGLALGCTHEVLWLQPLCCILGEGRLRAQGQPVEPQDATPALPRTVCFIWHAGRAVYGFTGTPCDKMRWGFSEGGQCLTKSTVLSLIALGTGAGVATDAVLTHPVVLARAGGAPPAT